MKKYLILCLLVISNYVCAQVQIGTDHVEIWGYNESTKEYEYSREVSTTTIFDFKENFKKLTIDGYFEDEILINHKEYIEENDVVLLRGISSDLTDLSLVFDYDNNVVKIAVFLNTETIMYMFNIVAKKKNNK